MKSDSVIPPHTTPNPSIAYHDIQGYFRDSARGYMENYFLVDLSF